MQMEEVAQLRKNWSNEECDHPGYDKEYDMGVQTGDCVCTQCGSYLSDQEVEAIKAKTRH